MQLSRFSASKVFGYLDFDFEIEHLAFLIGPNGSGKSTALHLMESVLTPSLRDLAFIKFESVELTFIDVDESRKTVRVYKGARNLKVSADWISESLDIPDLGDEKAQLLSEDSRSSDEYFRSLSIHLSSHPAFKAIAELPAPVFLGIDRRHRAGAIREAEPNEPSGFQLGRRGIHARRILTGNLAAGLSETQLLIQEAYRTARKKMDSYQQRLRNNVLLSAFHYSELQRDEDGSPNFDELEPHKDFDVLAVRQSIEKTLSDIGLDSDAVAQRISPFFEKLSQLI